MSSQTITTSSQVFTESSFLPVSKFTKYQTHIVCANKHFIVYTPSKRGIVRVIKQENGRHLALDTHSDSNVNFLHLWDSPQSSSLLAIGSDEGTICFYELSHPNSSADITGTDYQYLDLVDLRVDFTEKRIVCKSIPFTRFITFSLDVNLYVYQVMSKENSEKKNAVIEFNSPIRDYCFHKNCSNLAVITEFKKLTLSLFTFSLDDLLARKYNKYSTLNFRSTQIKNATNTWFASISNQPASFQVLTTSNSRLTLYDSSLKVTSELLLKDYVDDGKRIFTQFENTTNSIFLGSVEGASYLVKLNHTKQFFSFGTITELVYPKIINPLHYSVSPNLSGVHPVLDVYIFHTKGLSILPVSLESKTNNKAYTPTPSDDITLQEKVSSKVKNEVQTSEDQKPTLSETHDNLRDSIVSCLNSFKLSPRFPKNVDESTLNGIISIISESGIIDIISEHAAKVYNERLERLEALITDKVKDVSTVIQDAHQDSIIKFDSIQKEVSSKQIEILQDVSQKNELDKTPTDNIGKNTNESTSSNILYGSIDLNENTKPKDTAIPETDYLDAPDTDLSSIEDNYDPSDLEDESFEPEVQNLSTSENDIKPIVLSNIEQELLSALESQDMGYAVRHASMNVGKVNLTRVLKLYISEDENAGNPEGLVNTREAELINSLMTGDTVILLSFIAILSSDLANIKDPSLLDDCLHWLQKLVIIINDNFPKYQDNSLLIEQIYVRARDILQGLTIDNPLKSSVINELSRKF